MQTPPSGIESQAARAWLCRLASGYASGRELIQYLVDDRETEGPRAGVQRYEAAAADALLRWWEQKGVIARGAVARDLSPEQRINYGRSAASHPSAYGYGPGPAYTTPKWVNPPTRKK